MSTRLLTTDAKPQENRPKAPGIQRNIFSNALAGSLTAVLSLVLIRYQIKALGVEAYGLIAFVASLQIIFSIFDFGLSPTITREVASAHLSLDGRQTVSPVVFGQEGDEPTGMRQRMLLEIRIPSHPNSASRLSRNRRSGSSRVRLMARL